MFLKLNIGYYSRIIVICVRSVEYFSLNYNGTCLSVRVFER